MKKLNKYHWLTIIGTVSFILFWRTCENKSYTRNLSNYYPLEVIDNEIIDKKSGDVLYRFIPVDGGMMDFLYSDSLNINGKMYDYKTGYVRYINSFILGETPVTKRLWEYVMHNNTAEDEEGVKNLLRYYPIYESDATANEWNTFIGKLESLTGRSFGLPTSYQWEFAARGGNKSKKYKYAGSDNINEVAFYDKNHFPNIFCTLGKQRKPNELGFYDMSGCVWELTTTKSPDIFPQEEVYVGLRSYFSMGICRGGDYNSQALECETQRISSLHPYRSGARLILNY